MKPDRSFFTAATLAGAVLALLALLVPSSLWITTLRGSQAEVSTQLLTGAFLFRVSLAILGAFMILGAYLGWWRPGTASSHRRVTPRAELVVALGLLAAGAALRLYGLNQGLWADEVWTLVDYVRPPMGEIVTTYGSQNQHFLFSELAHLSITTFGESAWSLRLPAAFFGIATLWAFWRLALDLTSPREALLGMAMLTLSYQHIWFSQNARGYSALLFWTIVSSHYLVRALRERSPRLWFAYAVTAALGMYTHMTMGFVVAGQLAVYLWEEGRRREEAWSERAVPFFSGFGLAGLLTVACYALVLPQMPQAAAADLSNVAEWRSPLWMMQEIGRELNAGPPLVLVAAVGLIIVGSGFISYWRQSPVLPLLFAVPAVLGAATMVALAHHLWPRFFFFTAGFGILLVVRGLSVMVQVAARWLRWPEQRSTTFATVTTVLVILLLARSLPYVYRPKQDYAGARDFVEAQRQPGDAIVAVGVASYLYHIYYAPEWSTAATIAELEAIRDRHPRTWLVYTLPIEMENTYPEIYASARKEYELIRTFDGSLGDGAIYVRLADARKGG